MQERYNKSKEELRDIASKVIDLLRKENLCYWQVGEVLRFATEQLRNEKLK